MQTADEIRAIHFAGATLKNDSTAHGNTLTGDMYAAVRALAAGKSIDKKSLDKEAEGRFNDGGIVAIAQAVADVM